MQNACVLSLTVSPNVNAGSWNINQVALCQTREFLVKMMYDVLHMPNLSTNYKIMGMWLDFSSFYLAVSERNKR